MILAIDSGTTSCRTLAFNANGRCVSVSQTALPLYYPQPGWVEQNAEEIWKVQKTTMEYAARQVGTPNIRAIGLSNQRETVVVWEKATGKPLAPAIVWQCRRTTELCLKLKATGVEAVIRQKTGLLLDPYFSATKISWLLENVPGLRDRAEKGEVLFGTVDTWLMWRMTNGETYATDPSNASRTLLYNLHTNSWDDELLALFNIPKAALPQIQPSGSQFGNWRGDPIFAVLGDQQASLYGQACTLPGMAKCTFGTGCFLLKNGGSSIPTPNDGILSTVAWQLGPSLTYASEGSVFIGGAAVQWLRDNLGLIANAEESAAIAASVPDSGGVTFVPAFTGLGAPHWSPESRGLLCGLTRGTTRAHIVRATLEAIAHQNADVLAGMGAIKTLRVDGGASQNDFLMQIQADFLGIPVERSANLETTSTGVGALAGQLAGIWDGLPYKVERVFEPKMSEDERACRREGWRQAVQRAL